MQQQSSDSINWPPEFSELKRLDVILKCGICYDFMSNCMITSCSHTYCSLCIRKFMQYKNQCPTCYEETFEVNLRNNRLLDEVIIIYSKIRDKLLRASRLASVQIPVKGDQQISLGRKSCDNETEIIVDNDSNKIEQKNPIDKLTNNRLTDVEKILPKLPTKDDDSVVLNGIKIPGMFTSPKVSSIRPRKPEELTDCPVCQVKVPAKNINIHLDSCLALVPANKPKVKVRKRSPLPKRVYTMMPEKALKKFLKDYGLNTSGDRKMLISRLQRYTVIYNAENDAPNPRPVSELIKQLEREEKEEKKPQTLLKNFQVVVRPTRNDSVEAIEKANKAYCEENKASFHKLIEEMRARQGRNIKPLKPTNRIYSDDEDDPNRDQAAVLKSNDVPTTSGTSSQSSSAFDESYKHHNRITDPGMFTDDSCDSDGDIFIDSAKTKTPNDGLINWNKTIIDNDDEEENDDDDDDDDNNREATPEKSIYEMATQKPLDSSKENEKNDEEEIKILNEDNSLSPEYPESSESSLLFDCSINKNNNISVENTNSMKKCRRRLSLAWKNNNLSQNNDDEDSLKDDSLRENILKDDPENMNDKEIVENDNVMDNKFIDDQIDNDNDDDDDNLMNTNDEQQISRGDILNKSTTSEELLGFGKDSGELSMKTPEKRLTRSAKRKTLSTEKKDENQFKSFTAFTRKKSKKY